MAFIVDILDGICLIYEPGNIISHPYKKIYSST